MNIGMTNLNLIIKIGRRWFLRDGGHYITHHIATTSDIVVLTDGEPDLSQETKTKVFVTS